MADNVAEREEAVPPGEGSGLGLLGPKTRHLLAVDFGSTAQCKRASAFKYVGARRVNAL